MQIAHLLDSAAGADEDEDDRIEKVLLPIRDGLYLIRKR
jgi:hypothetical protein